MHFKALLKMKAEISNLTISETMPLDSNEVNVNLTVFQTNGHFKLFGQKLSHSNQVQHDYSEAPCISDFGWLFQYIYLTYQCINKTCFNEV